MGGDPLVLGTAGHVDHGKTSLVRALTGRDTDRLAAEVERGMSIELGFAPLDLPSGRRVSLIDVPGHERFVRHMVAGSTGVDGYLLCLAADDGVMPQTREHMAVLDLLGVREGVVAMTRCDLADPAPATAQARALLGPGIEIVPVCAPSGDGVADLRDALERLVAGLAPRRAGGRPRLFVDRAFTVRGTGTVVTGTLWGGPIGRGDRVRVVPGGRAGRVRGVEVHDEPAERAAGGRVALALAGVARDEAPRGACIVLEDDAWEAAARLVARLRWLDPAAAEARRTGRLRLFLGTAEVTALHRPLRGDDGRAELRLDRPVPAERGDRLVLRSPDGRTVGGGEVVEVRPAAAPRPAVRPSRSPAPAPAPAPAPLDAAAEAAVAAALERGGLQPADAASARGGGGPHPRPASRGARLPARRGARRAGGRPLVRRIGRRRGPGAGAGALAERPLTLGRAARPLGRRAPPGARAGGAPRRERPHGDARRRPYPAARRPGALSRRPGSGRAWWPASSSKRVGAGNPAS